MRRQEISQTGTQFDPYGPNLVFYAPLTEGDLTDHISGNLGADFTSNATHEWDITNQMYHFQRPQGYGNCFQWKNLNLGLDLTNSGCTLFFDFILDTNGHDRGVFIGTNIDTSNNYVYLTGVGFLGQPERNTLLNYCSVQQPNKTRIRYIDKNVVDTGTWAIDSRISTLYLNQLVSVGFSATNSSGHRTNIYVKDIRIYNKALSHSEISQL